MPTGMIKPSYYSGPTLFVPQVEKEQFFDSKILNSNMWKYNEFKNILLLNMLRY